MPSKYPPSSKRQRQYCFEAHLDDERLFLAGPVGGASKEDPQLLGREDPLGSAKEQWLQGVLLFGVQDLLHKVSIVGWLKPGVGRYRNFGGGLGALHPGV